MRLGNVKLTFLLIPLFCLPIVAQNGAQKPPQDKAAQKDPKEKLGADQFEEAHKNIFANTAEKAKEIGQFTEQAAKRIGGGSAAMSKMDRKNFIDEYIFDRIERDGIPHAGLSTDEEFIRRVYLDATGSLPTPEAVREFVANKAVEKRDKLIDSLIGTDAFAEQWAWFWGDFYRLGGLSGNGRNAFQYWTKEWL